MILEILYYPTIILTLFLEFKQLCELGFFFNFELKLLQSSTVTQKEILVPFGVY